MAGGASDAGCRFVPREFGSIPIIVQGQLVLDCIERACKMSDCSLWGVEALRRLNDQVLCIYVEKSDFSSVGVDDCASVSDIAKDLMELNGEGQHYDIIEVSSPGSDRRIFAADQLSRFVGRWMSCKFVMQRHDADDKPLPLSQLMQLEDLTDGVMHLVDRDDRRCTCTFDDLGTMRLVPTWDEPTSKQIQGRKRR